jgi:hypothetical protein
MKTKDSVSLEQAYLKVLKEDSEMDFLAQQDPREAYPHESEETQNINSGYEALVDNTVKEIVNQIQGATMSAENQYPDASCRLYTDIITRLTDILKKQSR